MNAKELVLKKINSDINWSDIYTTAFMLGESLEDIGTFMIDPEVNKILNGFNSSIFGYGSTNKLDYLNSLKDEKANPKLDTLINFATAAEEIRILGRMLKINQGLPVSINDFWSLVQGIEKFVESRINNELIQSYNQQVAYIKKLETEIENEPTKKELKQQLAEANKKKSELAEKYESEYSHFNLFEFIKDPDVKAKFIGEYEKNKVHFNILDVISSVPHFEAMFSMIGLNYDSLGALSVRDKVQFEVWRQYNIKTDDMSLYHKPLNSNAIRAINDAVDQSLRQKWIYSKDIVFFDDDKEIQLANEDGLEQFVKYVENKVIPLLKDTLSNNKFVKNLTYGLRKSKDGSNIKIPFYRIGINMVQIDDSEKTKFLYEEILNDFDNLPDGTDEINVVIKDQNNEFVKVKLVDIFYLYNLLVNKDKFGPNSMTRLFENLVGDETLLLHDFNNWIDKTDPQIIINDVLQHLNEVDEVKNPVIKLNTSEDKLENNETNTSLVITNNSSTTAQKAKEVEGIDTLRHPDANGMHFGNPFSHTKYNGVQKVMPNVKEAVIAFEQWLRGEAYQEIEPERRAWIINQINNGALDDKPIVYYTDKVPDNSYGRDTYDYYEAPNHAHILLKLINEHKQLGKVQERTQPTQQSLFDDSNIDFDIQPNSSVFRVTRNESKALMGNLNIDILGNSYLWEQLGNNFGIEDFNIVENVHSDSYNKNIIAVVKDYKAFKNTFVNNILGKVKNGNEHTITIFDLNSGTWMNYNFNTNEFESIENDKLPKRDISIISYFADWESSDVRNATLAINSFYSWILDNRIHPETTEPDFDSSIGYNEIIDDNQETQGVEELKEEISNDPQRSYPSENPVSTGKSELIETIRQMNNENPYIKIITDEMIQSGVISKLELAHKGFIKDGIIYINPERANDDTVIHEIGHIYLAQLKKTNPNAYYELLQKVRTTDTYKKLARSLTYGNKKLSDLDEEVLATLLSDNFAKFNQTKEERLIVKEALNLLGSDFKDWLKNTKKLPNIDESFINFYAIQQRIATIKNKLMNKVIEHC